MPNIYHCWFSLWRVSSYVPYQYAIRPFKKFIWFLLRSKHLYSHAFNQTSFKIRLYSQQYFSWGKWFEQTFTWQWWQFIWWLSVLIAQSWQTTHCPAKILHRGLWSGQPSGLLTSRSLKYNTFTSLTLWPLGDVVEILLKIRFHWVMTFYLFAICIDCPVFANLDL